ncbi:MAG: type III-B CRISPR module-associated protein Cmr5 [Akkermansiaceae bacterium]|nr:type III-B CRISPR module-associated protein Cmr5 [Akkermansiaceae bacterium]
MTNIDQIRAAHALSACSHERLKRSAISSLPCLIINNGLLATVAYVKCEGGGANRPHQVKAMESLADHLKNQGITNQQTNTLSIFANDLANNSPVNLQRATAEALAYFSFLKRFADMNADDNAVQAPIPD